MAELIGIEKLNRRLAKVGDGRAMLHKLQIESVANAKRLVPRKTGNLGRTIHPGSVSERDAFVWASANYAAYVERGTKPHDIRPRNKRALRFPATGTPTTLGGRVRSGIRRDAGRVPLRDGRPPSGDEGAAVPPARRQEGGRRQRGPDRHRALERGSMTHRRSEPTR